MDQTLKVANPIHEDIKDQLYPLRDSYKEHFLEVSELHTVWIGEYGNPKGIPIIFLHGSPGGGCMPNVAQFYNPDVYRIILVDQRGCGKSSPQDEIQENTTQDLIADLEKIRKHLQINKWIVTGGSWGATLALAYR